MDTIAAQIKQADSVYIFIHENMDGDALGSGAALCSYLRRMGKTAFVIRDGEVPQNLAFMDRDYCRTSGQVPVEHDMSIAVDCSEKTRFPHNIELFDKAGNSACVDHHLAPAPLANFNYVDPDAAASAELIFKLFKAMGPEPDKEEAEALFAGITTDTGNFQYSNTTKETHEIAAQLYDYGIDANHVSVEIYETVPFRKLNLSGMALDRAEIYADGKIAMTVVTQDMLAKAGAIMNDSEGIVSELRSIAGVEVAILVKESDDGRVFVSLRSKTEANVQKIAAKFGGGGHVKAAGCTVSGKSWQEVYEDFKNAAAEEIQ